MIKIYKLMFTIHVPCTREEFLVGLAEDFLDSYTQLNR